MRASFPMLMNRIDAADSDVRNVADVVRKEGK